VRPFGKLMPVDQRSAPLVAIGPSRPHAGFSISFA
jgi:hypothetical protein